MWRRVILLVALMPLLVGCGAADGRPTLEATPSLKLTTGMAIVLNKMTQAAELTSQPRPTEPVERVPTTVVLWTPSPGEIVASDNGKTIDVVVTGRVSIILDQQTYPIANLVEECHPDGVLGRVANLQSCPRVSTQSGMKACNWANV